MLECSSCGKYIGHLMKDYYDMTILLVNDLERHEGKPRLDGNYVTSEGRDIKPYLRTYYDWANDSRNYGDAFVTVVGPGGRPVTQPYRAPNAVIARALLSIKPLSLDDLPYGVEEDGQRSMFEERYCCQRMFLTDPTFTA